MKHGKTIIWRKRKKWRKKRRERERESEWVSVCEWMQHCLQWFMIWSPFFSLPPPYHWAMFCFRDLQIIARYVNTPFLLCIHLIYSLSFQSIFNDFRFSCMFITINSGSIIFYLFIYCLSCLNINRVCKTFLFLFLYNCFTSFHLFDSLARTSC